MYSLYGMYSWLFLNIQIWGYLQLIYYFLFMKRDVPKQTHQDPWYDDAIKKSIWLFYYRESSNIDIL